MINMIVRTGDPLEGQLPWDFACVFAVGLCKARRCLFDFILGTFGNQCMIALNQVNQAMHF